MQACPLRLIFEHELGVCMTSVLLLQDYTPALTYIIVQKRHHTRIFPSDGRDADRSGNVMAGMSALTMVDLYCSPAALYSGGLIKPCKQLVIAFAWSAIKPLSSWLLLACTPISKRMQPLLCYAPLPMQPRSMSTHCVRVRHVRATRPTRRLVTSHRPQCMLNSRLSILCQL